MLGAVPRLSYTPPGQGFGRTAKSVSSLHAKQFITCQRMFSVPNTKYLITLLWRILSSATEFHMVQWKSADVSEEYVASIFEGGRPSML
jgi:hypothetical protein